MGQIIEELKDGFVLYHDGVGLAIRTKDSIPELKKVESVAQDIVVEPVTSFVNEDVPVQEPIQTKVTKKKR